MILYSVHIKFGIQSCHICRNNASFLTTIVLIYILIYIEKWDCSVTSTTWCDYYHAILVTWPMFIIVIFIYNLYIIYLIYSEFYLLFTIIFVTDIKKIRFQCISLSKSNWKCSLYIQLTLYIHNILYILYWFRLFLQLT